MKRHVNGGGFGLKENKTKGAFNEVSKFVQWYRRV
jgi:hypothetical protein